ncbi:MAG: TIGR03986 family CRISPR-associated RAMP protein [Desulfatiglandales bacterium]
MGKFIYPFNFVSIAKDEQGKPREPERRETPSLKDFQGLSGSIDFELEVLTHLAVPDTSLEEIEGDGHKKYPFFNAEGKCVVPGSAIKGMIRSVFECLTNSCFSQMSSKPERFRKRVTKLNSGKDKPIQRADQSEYFVVHGRMVPSQSVRAGRIIQQGKKLLVQPMAWVYLYDSVMKGAANPRWVRDIPSKRLALLKDSDKFKRREKEEAFKHLDKVNGKEVTLTVPFSHTNPSISFVVGQTYYLTLEPGNMGNKWGRLNRIETSDGTPFPSSFKAEYEGKSGNELLFEVTGYLRVAGAIQKKHGDFLFVEYADQNNVEPIQLPETAGGPVGIEEAFKQANKNHPFLLETLKHGQTVWYQTQKQYGFGSDKLQIGYAQIFPFVSPFTLQDKIPASHQPCQSGAVCPACRLFGFVGDSEGASCSGRLRFRDSKYVGEPVFETLHLKELSSPKPSCSPFYLSPSPAEIPDTREVRRLMDAILQGAEEVTGLTERESGFNALNDYLESLDYGNAESRGRGRKFYLHHGNSFQVQSAMESNPDGDGRDRRATVEALCPSPEKHFHLTVDFQNLQCWELGLLLLSTTLDFGGDEPRSLAHKLGRGRPLGLGSVKVKLEKVRLQESKSLFTDWAKGFNTLEVIENNQVELLEFMILGHLWLIQTFCGDQKVHDLQSRIRPLFEKKILGAIAGECLGDDEAAPSENDLEAVSDMVKLQWAPAPFCDRRNAPTLLQKVTLQDSPDALSQEQMDGIYRDMAPEVLKLIQKETAEIPHIHEMMLLLQREPSPFFKKLSVRYPQPRAGGQDIRAWFNTNFRPLPFPDKLSRVDHWTLVD